MIWRRTVRTAKTPKRAVSPPAAIATKPAKPVRQGPRPTSSRQAPRDHSRAGCRCDGSAIRIRSLSSALLSQHRSARASIMSGRAPSRHCFNEEGGSLARPSSRRPPPGMGLGLGQRMIDRRSQDRRRQCLLLDDGKKSAVRQSPRACCLLAFASSRERNNNGPGSAAISSSTVLYPAWEMERAQPGNSAARSGRKLRPTRRQVNWPAASLLLFRGIGGQARSAGQSAGRRQRTRGQGRLDQRPADRSAPCRYQDFARTRADGMPVEWSTTTYPV
jgi:hypothetical protein